MDFAPELRADLQRQPHEPVRQSKQHGAPPVLHQLWGLLLATSPLLNPARAPIYYLLLFLNATKYDPSAADVTGPRGAGGER